jgi:hypothetical protein
VAGSSTPSGSRPVVSSWTRRSRRTHRHRGDRHRPPVRLGAAAALQGGLAAGGQSNAAEKSHPPEPSQISTLITAQIDCDRTITTSALHRVRVVPVSSGSQLRGHLAATLFRLGLAGTVPTTVPTSRRAEPSARVHHRQVSEMRQAILRVVVPITASRRRVVRRCDARGAR